MQFIIALYKFPLIIIGQIDIINKYMTNFICKHCDNLECETSVCPVCGRRAELIKQELYYCNNCQTPVFDKKCSLCGSECSYIGTDCRPVFPTERLLLEILQDKIGLYKKSSIWNSGANHYIIDGVKKNIPLNKLKENFLTEDLINKLKENNPSFACSEFLKSKSILNFVKANAMHLNKITFEAIDYIKQKTKYKSNDEMFVSFSGGKDSTVVSDLVRKALGNDIIHIYGDTSIEYPYTYQYIDEFKKINKNTPFLVAKNKEQDFYSLCKVIGPPARMLRWCCTVFKTGAITKKIESTFGDSKKIIVFQGIRRNESESRKNYERSSESSKIKKQIAIMPIIDWLDADVWLYILSNNLKFNKAYELGFSRVGCWCCPNNSQWSGFLSSIYMNDEYKKFTDILYDFAKKTGKTNIKEYVEAGEWKKRQGGIGINISKNTVVSYKPCVLEENTFNYNLKRPISEKLYVLFIPFGILNFDIGNKVNNEVYVLDRKSGIPILRISGRIGTTDLKISILNNIGAFKDIKKGELYLKYQINKYQMCIGCSGCSQTCKQGAISIHNEDKNNVSIDNIEYYISDKKCIGCLECVSHYPGGCYLNKVLKIRRDTYKKMENIG